jgi:outer membrane protein TolC
MRRLLRPVGIPRASRAAGLALALLGAAPRAHAQTPSAKAAAKAAARAAAVATSTAAVVTTPAAAVVAAPAVATGPTLALEEILHTTLIHNPQVRFAANDVEAARAAREEAGAPFDSALEVTALGSQNYQFTPPGIPLATSLVRGVSASAQWARRFRNGLLVSPELLASGTRVFEDPRLDVRQATARLKVAVPLLRDRGGAITAAPEQAAGVAQGASIMTEHQTVAEVVLQAAAAYWGYLATERSLSVLVASEERARRTVEETTALVKADERTGADLIQAEGYLSSARAARMAGEQQRLEAGRQLALLSGRPWAELSGLPRATTDFPATLPAPSKDLVPRWLQLAMNRRPDRAAADANLRSAEILAEAARRELGARLDLEVVAGYTGQESGAGGRLQRVAPGPEGSVGLRYQLPVETTGARGRFDRQRSVVARLQLARAELVRQIEIGVTTAFETVRNTELRLRESNEAVRLLERTVANEKRKFQLGSSTLFSVKQAEESLTGALLEAIEGRRQYAVALATLRYETATLGRADAGTDLRAEASDQLVAHLTSFPP